MPDLRKLDYFYLRYSPHAAMDDYITIGVIMMENAPDGFAEVRLSRNYRRVLCSHPDADLDYFRALEEDLRTRLSTAEDRNQLVGRLNDTLGNALQLSPPHALLSEDPQAEIERLVRQAIDLPLVIPVRTSKVHLRGRRFILHKMEDSFDHAGVLHLLARDVPASQYTDPGDPFKIDFSYQPNGIVKMLQAMSLQVSSDSAKSLAFTYPRLAEGIARKKGARSSMTAIVDDDLDRGDPRIAFALGTLEQVGIEVAITSELPGIANETRRELMG